MRQICQRWSFDLAAVAGFEPTGWENQNLLPYHLAKPQNISRVSLNYTPECFIPALPLRDMTTEILSYEFFESLSYQRQAQVLEQTKGFEPSPSVWRTEMLTVDTISAKQAELSARLEALCKDEFLDTKHSDLDLLFIISLKMKLELIAQVKTEYSHQGLCIDLVSAACQISIYGAAVHYAYKFLYIRNCRQYDLASNHWFLLLYRIINVLGFRT